MKKASISVLPSADAAVSFKGYRFSPDIIRYAVWLYFRFPLSLRMVPEMHGRGQETARGGRKAIWVSAEISQKT